MGLSCGSSTNEPPPAPTALSAVPAANPSPTPTLTATATAEPESPEPPPTDVAATAVANTVIAEPSPTMAVATPQAATATSIPPTPTATPTASLEPVSVRVFARGLSFEPSALSIPSHVPVTLEMVNEHDGVLHDVGVNVVGGGRTDTCAGPCTSSVVFAAHVPGSYQFFCSLHPEMVGSLTVR